MTANERKGIDLIQGGAELLRNAIVKGESHRDLEFRARDLLADIDCLKKFGRVVVPAAR